MNYCLLFHGYAPWVRENLRKMKLTVLLLCISTLASIASAGYAQSTKLTVIKENATVKSILDEIQNQSEFKFFYSSEVDVDRIATIDMKDKVVFEILDELFKNSNVKYEVYERQIALVDKSDSFFNRNFPQSQNSTQQQPAVSGKVTDAAGQALPGVTVMVKGTTHGTVTNADGEYSMTNIPDNATLVFSFVGMHTQEIVVGDQTVINVTLAEEAIGLEEVVVTALGITRQKRELNYAIQEVEGEQLSKTGHIDASKGLQGKVAGVTVRQLSGAPGRSTSIRIRGSNSLRGSNDPLFVVDGSPVVSDVALAINPNEIENMSVLKGATAAALYGLRASNGVVLITTKRGAKNEMNKPTVSFNSTYSFDRLAVYPELQQKYGQGVYGEFDPYSSFSFGPKISEWGTYTNQLGEQEEARAYDAAKEFFRTGGTQDHNIGISNRFNRGNYAVGIGYSGQEGIIPNTDFSRASVKLAGDYDFTEKLKISTSVNYSTSTTHSFNEEGGSGSLFYASFGAPVSYDLKNKPTHVEGNPYQQINYRGQHDNIYWILDNSGVTTNRSTLLGSVGVNYTPFNWLNLNYRIGLDESSFEEREIYGFGSGATGGRTVPPSGGRITEDMRQTTNINSTFLATANHKIADILDLEIMAGNEFYDYNYKRLASTGNDFTVPDLHHLSNASSITSTQSWSRSRSYAFFGNLQMTYAEMLSLTVTGRDDVVSNMPRGNRSFFYPSVGMGFIFTEVMDKSGALTFGKVRASYAEVGQAGGIYSTSTVYTKSSASRFSFPYLGINAFNLSSNLKSTDLVPENTKGWEVGANLVFFKNRINFDYTYYNSKSEGQIFSVPVSATTGFTVETRNAGEMVNQGHEILLTLRPVVTDNFSWDFATNFSAFTNKVTKLAEGVDELVLGGNSYVAYVVAREGEPYPVLRGYGYTRDENGKIVVKGNDPESYNYGMPLRSPSADVIFGKVDPDFEINFMSTFRYKNISLYAQVDWRQGGVMNSGDSRLTKLYGTHYETQFREEDYIVPDAVKGYYDDDGNLVVQGENDIVINRDYDYWRRVMDGLGEQNVYDASFIRLREVRINYDFPSRFLQNSNVFKGGSVYLVGRNLWLIKSGLPHFDPEMNSNSGNAYGYSYTGYPQISNYGFGINLKF
jgi:TonB-linked SusC/RagA family outer membrane protein